jgi:hypothetical protein
VARAGDRAPATRVSLGPRLGPHGRDPALPAAPFSREHIVVRPSPSAWTVSRRSPTGTASVATSRAGWEPNCTATRRPRDANARRAHREHPQPAPLHVRHNDRACAIAQRLGRGKLVLVEPPQAMMISTSCASNCAPCWRRARLLQALGLADDLVDVVAGARVHVHGVVAQRTHVVEIRALVDARERIARPGLADSGERTSPSRASACCGAGGAHFASACGRPYDGISPARSPIG